MKETKEQLRARVGQILRALKKTYPQATCALNHASPFELLIATILSAQCTDDRVNNSVTFFRNKARSIQEASRLLIEKHNGQIPQTLEDLVELPGVGRKTANVVLGTAFGIPTGVVVDTHVSRVSQRLGLTENKQPEKIEADLIELLPKKEWIDFSHRLIWHGRRVCQARKPMCEKCSLEKFCPSSTLKK